MTLSSNPAFRIRGPRATTAGRRLPFSVKQLQTRPLRVREWPTPDPERTWCGKLARQGANQAGYGRGPRTGRPKALHPNNVQPQQLFDSPEWRGD